jgi:hypothetical protein
MLDQLAKQNAVAAIRVSTVKQGINGDSPEDQQNQIERYADAHGLNITKYFLFLESASKELQPMQEVVNYCKNPKNNIQQFIIKSIDRFTRGGSYSYDKLKNQLDDCGVALVDIYGVISSQRINTLEHLGVKYKWSEYSPTKKSEMLEAERAKDEIRDIQTRMIGAQIRYARMGYWVRRPLFGFDNEHIETSDGKRCILTPNSVEAPYVKKMFNLRARGSLSDEQIVDEINRLGFSTRVRIVRDKDDRSRIIEEIGGEPLTLKVLWHTLENPVYAGINPEKWTQDKPVRCKFPGLVSIELFNKANNGKVVISDNKDELSIFRRKPADYLLKKGVKNEEFPYKRIVMCPHCDKPLFGSASRGRRGKYYPAYHCNKRGHYFRVSTKDFDATVEQFVRSIHIAPEFAEALTSAVLSEWDKRQVELHKDDLALDTRIRELRTQVRLAVDKIKFLNSEIAIKYMEEELVRTEAEIAELMVQKEQQIMEKPTNIDKVIASVKYFLEHLEYLLLQQSNPIAKAKFFALLFDKIPNYQEILSGTAKLTPILEVNQHFLDNSYNLSLMAGSEGFEPPILGPEPSALPLGQLPTPNLI